MSYLSENEYWRQRGGIWKEDKCKKEWCKYYDIDWNDNCSDSTRSHKNKLILVSNFIAFKHNCQGFREAKNERK